MTKLINLGVLALLLSISNLQAQIRSSARSPLSRLKPEKKQAWIACKTCPIVWYSTAEELAEIKRKYREANKDVDRWGTTEIFDPYSWSWAKKVRFWKNAGIKIEARWQEEHRLHYPNDPTLPPLKTLNKQ
ncbi:MAG: hypothetical protein AAFR87_28785 [Bacteroidota bacterium]